MPVATVLLLLAAPQAVAVPAFAPRLRSRADAAEWDRAHQPDIYELPWLRQPWHLDLAAGVDAAWAARRPLALWLGDGHPFGAAGAAELSLRPAWLDAAVRAAGSEFEWVADDARELAGARANHPALDAWLTRAAGDGEEPLTAGTLLFAAADGTPIARAHPGDADELAAAFAAAAAAWRDSVAGRAAAPDPPQAPSPLPRFFRRADAFPLDGLALELTHRACGDPADGAPELLDGPWNRDWLWLDPGAAAALVPAAQGVGSRAAWPDEAARRLARLALADSSAGRAVPFADEEIIHSSLVLRPLALRSGRRAFRLDGVLAAQRDGVWEPSEANEDPFAAGLWTPAGDGVRARAVVAGWMETEADSGRVLALQFTALVQTATADGVAHHVVLARRLDPLEDGARHAASLGGADVAADAAGPLPRRMRALFAETVPQLDGACDEKAWNGTLWSEDFGGARARMSWNAEHLFLAVWSPRPGLAARIADREWSVGADGSVAGVEGARVAVGGGAGSWIVELALPWRTLIGAGVEASAPVAGAELRLNLRAGGEDAPWWSPGETGDARVLLLPSRVAGFQPGSGVLR